MAFDGLLSQIANPQMADIAGAIDFRQKRLQEEQQRQKDAKMKELMGQAIPHLREGSVLQQMAQEDPERFMMFTKAVGIPIDQAGQIDQMSKDVRQISKIMATDPEGAISYADSLAAEREKMGLDTTKIRGWVDLARTDSGKAGRAMTMLDQTLNSDLIAAEKEAARKVEMENKKFGLDERQVAAQEKRANSMTPFEAAQVKHWNDTASSDGGGLSADAIELFADRLLNGEQPNKVLANLGRGAQGAADLRAVQNRLAEKAKARGIDANKILQNTQNTYADNRTFLELGAREGKIAPRVMEANSFAKIALDASDKVPRESFVPWNKLSQYTDKQLSDPKLAALHAATQSLVNAYASAVGGGVMTEGNRQEANRMLYDAQGPDAYKAVVNQMLVETQAALDSPKLVREHMHAEGNKASDAGKETAAQRFERLKGGH